MLILTLLYPAPSPPFPTPHHVDSLLPFRSGLSARLAGDQCPSSVSRLPYMPHIVVLGTSVPRLSKYSLSILRMSDLFPVLQLSQPEPL